MISGNGRLWSLSDQFIGRAGALLSLVTNDEITDILVNGVHSIYVEADGCLEPVPSPFPDQQSILDLIERMLIPLGKRIDAAHPYLDGRLADGSRFHIVLPPIAPEGPIISIRKKRKSENCPLDSFSCAEVVEWLATSVGENRNMLISGGTGTGKTTLLTRLLEIVSPLERIIVIEECLEIEGRHPHLVHLEARAASPDGTGEVTLRSLIKNALRMRPDRLILGECRGAEAFDLIQVMNSGHHGSFCTLHANSARDALRRLESLVLMSGCGAKVSAVREWISGAIDVVVHLRKDGANRQIAEIISVNGIEGEAYRIIPRLGFSGLSPGGGLARLC